MHMKSTVEKWRTYVAQSQKYARSIKKQQEEIAALQEKAGIAQTLESRMELQTQAVALLYDEAALRKTRSEELAGQLLEKQAELDALVAEIDGMMKAENGRITTLDMEIATLTNELAAAQAERAELEGERAAALELGRDVDGRLHALLMERRSAEDEYKRKLAQIQSRS
jgi:chromosome segregation ATPase